MDKNRIFKTFLKLFKTFVVRFMVKIQEKRKGKIMARHGENIRKRKDGRWEGRYLEYSEKKGKKQYRSVYGRSYGEVKEKLAERKSKIYSIPGQTAAISRPAKEILLSEAAGKWLAEVMRTKKHSTYIKYSRIWNNHLQTIFQDIKISMITDSLVQRKLPDHLSESTRKSIYCVLNQILKYASGKYAVPVPRLKNPVCSRSNRPVTVFSRMEQTRLLSDLYQEMTPFKLAILLCLYTGLRLGEVCALKWEDLDVDNQIILVSRTVQRLYADGCPTKTTLLETSPKSAHSRRELPLPSVILKLLVCFRNGQPYIFGGGKPLEPRTLQYQFKKILEKAELEGRNFHTLRHTFSTNCIEGGTDIKSLSELLGHSDVQITLNRYVHPSMEIKRRHMDALSAFYNRICGQIYGQAG